MAEEGSMVILVSMDRVVYKLELQSLKLEDDILATTESIYRSYCDSDYRISRSSSRVVRLYIRCPEGSETEEHAATLDVGKTRLELKMFDLSGSADQVQSLELEYAERPFPNRHMHVITFSPDLSIVQAGAHVFDLLAPGHPPLSFPDNPLDGPRQGEGLSMTLSSCNRYLVLIKSKDDVTTDELATCGIFQINRPVGEIEKVVIPGLDDLVADRFAAAFHPELPLLVLTCLMRPEPGVRKLAKYISAIEIDLETLKHTSINIPKHSFDMHRP